MSEGKGKLIPIAAIVVIAVSGLSIWWRSRPPSMKLDPGLTIALPTAAGEALAEETVKAVHDKGNIVLVTDEDHQHARSERDPYCWKAFHRVLQQHGAIKI